MKYQFVQNEQHSLVMHSVRISIDQTRDYLLKLEQYLDEIPLFTSFVDFKQSNEQINKQNQVLMELLNTEQIYVDELRAIVEGYMMKLNDPNECRNLPSTIVQNRSILFSNLADIYTFHAKSFLPPLKEVIHKSSSISAIAACFIKQKSQFNLYEQYILNKSQSEQIWKEFCCGHEFFTKIQHSLGHRLSLDAYLLKPVQRITRYQLLLKEMIKYTRDEEERRDLQQALEVMLTVVSYLNDLMHSAEILGYSHNFTPLGPLRSRAEQCLIWRNKRGRSRPSRRDLFLFERKILCCKRKDSKSSKYQFKEEIQIDQILLLGSTNSERNQLEILCKDSSFTIEFSGKINQKPLIQRWTEMLGNSMSQRRIDIKQRSSSLDHWTSNRRRRERNCAL